MALDYDEVKLQTEKMFKAVFPECKVYLDLGYITIVPFQNANRKYGFVLDEKLLEHSNQPKLILENTSSASVLNY